MSKRSSMKSKLYSTLSGLENSFGISSVPYRRTFFTEVLLRYLLLPKETKRLIKRLKSLEENSVSMNESFHGSDHLIEIEKEIEQKNKQLNICQSEIEQLKKEADDLSLSNESLLKSKINTIKRVVAMRDQQLLRLDMAKKDDLKAFVPIFDSLCKENLKLLEHMGITEMPQIGSFDTARHIVVETRATHDSALHDTIAEVFRPGYFLQDEVFRPQEVIIYRYKAEDEK